MKTTTLEEIQKRAVAALSRYVAAPKGAGETEDLRETASCFIDAREHFWGKDGKPDWQGRTYAYRTWVREVMSEARVPPEDIQTVQAAVRYHTGNILRERLDDETLEDLGLRKESPRERSIEKRERYTDILSLFGGGGGAIDELDEIVTAVDMMHTTLRRVSFDSLTPKERREAKEVLAKVRQWIEDTEKGEQVTNE